MSSLRRLLLAAAVLLAIAGSAMYWRVGSALTAPVPRRVAPPPIALNAEVVTFTSASGSDLSAWYATPPDPQAALVLLHRARCDRTDMLSRAELLVRAGYAVLLPDLQAHGESPGEAITFGHLESKDAAAAVRFLRARHSDLPLGAIGVSLGGAALLLAVETLALDALVLESVYPTISEAVTNRVRMRLGILAKALAPLLLLQLEPRLGVAARDLRPIDHVASLTCPVLILSGTEDQHTTVAETRRMYAAAPEPKQLWLVGGAEHQDLLGYDREGYASTVLGFLQEHLTVAGAPGDGDR